MKKRLLIYITLLSTQLMLSQYLEIGTNLDFSASDIANSNKTEGRAVIGKSVWKFSEGLFAVYYFKPSLKGFVSAIRFGYTNSVRSHKSAINSSSRYHFNSDKYYLNYRMASRGIKSKIGSYLDVGLGYNKLKNNVVYSGTIEESVAFDDIKTPLVVRPNEVTFVAGLGIDKLFFKDKFALFCELNVEAGITTINQSSGSLRTQSLGFSTGLRYRLPLNK